MLIFRDRVVWLKRPTDQLGSTNSHKLTAVTNTLLLREYIKRYAHRSTIFDVRTSSLVVAIVMYVSAGVKEDLLRFFRDNQGKTEPPAGRPTFVFLSILLCTVINTVNTRPSHTSDISRSVDRPSRSYHTVLRCCARSVWYRSNPGNHVLRVDHANYMAPTRQRELDHTDHTYQEHIYLPCEYHIEITKWE